jgi:hypothetical protein
MAWVNGRCKAQTAAGAPIEACHYWLMVANNNNHFSKRKDAGYRQPPGV